MRVLVRVNQKKQYQQVLGIAFNPIFIGVQTALVRHSFSFIHFTIETKSTEKNPEEQIELLEEETEPPEVLMASQEVNYAVDTPRRSPRQLERARSPKNMPALKRYAKELQKLKQRKKKQKTKRRQSNEQQSATPPLKKKKLESKDDEEGEEEEQVVDLWWSESSGQSSQNFHQQMNTLPAKRVAHSKKK